MKNIKRVIFLVCILCMIITIFPISVYAIQSVKPVFGIDPVTGEVIVVHDPKKEWEVQNPKSSTSEITSIVENPEHVKTNYEFLETIKEYAVESLFFIYNNGYFPVGLPDSANKNMSRGSFANMFANIARYGDSSVQPVDVSVFSDISTSNGKGGQYQALYAKAFDFMDGIKVNDSIVFNGNKDITREEAAKVCVSFINSMCERYSLANPIKESELSFKDSSSISQWALSYVKSAVSCGIFKGDEKGNFNPKKNITCNEGFVIVYRTYKALYNVGYRTKLSPMQEQIYNELTQYPELSPNHTYSKSNPLLKVAEYPQNPYWDIKKQSGNLESNGWYLYGTYFKEGESYKKIPSRLRGGDIRNVPEQYWVDETYSLNDLKSNPYRSCTVPRIFPIKKVSSSLMGGPINRDLNIFWIEDGVTLLFNIVNFEPNSNFDTVDKLKSSSYSGTYKVDVPSEYSNLIKSTSIETFNLKSYYDSSKTNITVTSFGENEVDPVSIIKSQNVLVIRLNEVNLPPCTIIPLTIKTDNGNFTTNLGFADVNYEANCTITELDKLPVNDYIKAQVQDFSKSGNLTLMNFYRAFDVDPYGSNEYHGDHLSFDSNINISTKPILSSLVEKDMSWPIGFKPYLGYTTIRYDTMTQHNIKGRSYLDFMSDDESKYDRNEFKVIPKGACVSTKGYISMPNNESYTFMSDHPEIENSLLFYNAYGAETYNSDMYQEGCTRLVDEDQNFYTFKWDTNP